MWECPKCKTMNEHSFCGKCGTKRVQNAPPSPVAPRTPVVSPAPVEKKSGSKALIITIIICTALIVSACGALIYFTVLRDDPSDNNTSNKPEDKYNYSYGSSEGETPLSDVDEPKKAEDVTVGKSDPEVKDPDSADTSPVVPDPKPEPEPETVKKPSNGAGTNNNETVVENPPETVSPESENVTLSDSDFGTYYNSDFNITCAYPLSFYECVPSGINAIQQYASPEDSAIMTIRAVYNTSNTTIPQAINDYVNSIDGTVTYKANGKTWFAASIETSSGRAYYRKLFIKNGIICCMDFEMDVDEVDKYDPHINYIEDNFRVND